MVEQARKSVEQGCLDKQKQLNDEYNQIQTLLDKKKQDALVKLNELREFKTNQLVEQGNNLGDIDARAKELIKRHTPGALSVTELRGFIQQVQNLLKVRREQLNTVYIMWKVCLIFCC